MTIGCFCIGINKLDLGKATAELGIPVLIHYLFNTRSVARLIIGNSIMLLRGIPEKNKYICTKNWQKTAKTATITGKNNPGIIGYGHIGTQEISVLAESMGLKVIYFDIEPKLPLGNTGCGRYNGRTFSKSRYRNIARSRYSTNSKI